MARRAGGDTVGTNVLNAESWLNPSSGFSSSYVELSLAFSDSDGSDGSDAGDSYNAVHFTAGRASISGDASEHMSMGPRFVRQIDAGTTVTAVVTKSEDCSDHYVAFSTSGDPAPFHWVRAHSPPALVFDDEIDPTAGLPCSDYRVSLSRICDHFRTPMRTESCLALTVTTKRFGAPAARAMEQCAAHGVKTGGRCGSRTTRLTSQTPTVAPSQVRTSHRAQAQPHIGVLRACARRRLPLAWHSGVV